MKHILTFTFLISAYIILASVFVSSCTKDNQPDTKYFDGNLLPINIHKVIIDTTHPTDTLDLGYIQSLVNGTGGNGHDITATVFFDDPNHVAFDITIVVVDYVANEYHFTLKVPANSNQATKSFEADERIQVIAISKIKQHR